MVKIKEVSATAILDSRNEKTILVSIKTNAGNFSASAPTGKSTGKFEAKPYIKSIDDDIKKIKQISEYFSDEDIVNFYDLRKVEAICEGHIGANTLFALESAVLKAMAKEQKKQVWQLINLKAKQLPRLVGNVIGGGKHSKSDKKPDFQEFLLIPNTKTIKQAFELNKKIKQEAEFLLKKFDETFKSQKNDENAWQTSLNEKLVMDILYKLKEMFGLDIGLDVASSSFYSRKKYDTFCNLHD